MKVGMYYNNSDVRVEEQDIPKVGDKDILIKVASSGICGSDVMEWYRIKKAPLVLGHEVSGEIVEVGKDIKGHKVGDRVFTTHHVPCHECRYCLSGHETVCEAFHTKNNFTPGGFSEYLRVSGRSVEIGTLKLPDSVSYDEGSFIEPLGTVVRGIRALDLKPVDNLVVYGAGSAGLLTIKAAKAHGVGKIIAADISDYRLRVARTFGADYTINALGNVPREIKDLTGRLADKVVLSTGALGAAYDALNSVEKGGTVLLFAVPKPNETVTIDFNPYWRNDISIKTTYGAAHRDNCISRDLIHSKEVRVEDMITHRLPLEDIALGFKLTSEAKSCLKVIIKP